MPSVPLQILTSQKKYGPDGPWQAVSVSLGYPFQPLDLYPGGTFESIILAKTVCNGTSSDICGAGGLYDPGISSTVDTTSITYSAHSHGFAADWTLGAMSNRAEARYITDQLTLNPIGTQRAISVPDLSIRMITEISTIYPDGSEYLPQLGQLALGASNINQSFQVGNGDLINATLVPTYLFTSGVIASASYGLHIGSAALDLPLSLWFGGYDQSRVIGPINALPSHNNLLDNFFIDLLDIGFGVDNGASPFAYSSRDGLLAEGNSSISSSISVDLNPAAPYLYLPESTCAAILKDLPVTFQPKYGLYFWNTQDPQYARIISSPTYLGFTFRAANLDVANLTIKIPFQLLNLTLEQPLIDVPTPYFPCQPPQGSATYSLGRAFLQAAFIGVNWDQGLGHWYLAQAPGPNTAENPTQTLFTENMISSSTNWSDTWMTHWTALPVTDVNTTGETASKKSDGLSSGAYAGIGIGCALVVGIIGLFLVLLRRRRQHSRPSAPLPQTHEPKTQEIPYTDGEIYEAPEPEPREIFSGQQEQAWEMEHTEHSRHISELG
ncbi:MAG: hypothetical protein Q9222_007600 [Ikaeria aurantiellina]